MTKIEWTNKTWNPVVGCSKVSAGCQNCYAEKMMYRQVVMGCARYEKNPNGNEDAWVAYSNVMDEDTHKWNGLVALRPEILDKPLHWKEPRMIFVCSMGDLFHESVPFGFIDKVMEVIAMWPQQHIFQILTKRPEIMAPYFKQLYEGLTRFHKGKEFQWPFKNLWLGVTAENQKCWDERKDVFFPIPAAIHFVSNEPLLSEIRYTNDELRQLDQIIIGCESLPGGKAGRFQDGFIEAAIDVVRQCKAAGVKVFVKQVPVNGKISHNPEEWPEELRVREYPKSQPDA